MSEKTNILTPVGRLVQGDCFKGDTTDAEGRPLVIKMGPNAGQPRVSYFMALAIPKGSPGLAELQAAILATAQKSFPTLFDAAGNCVAPQFAFKFEDGDSTVPNTKGVRPCDREGFPGNMVFRFSGGFQPKCVAKGGTPVIIDPDAIKRGYFIRIAGTVAGNGAVQQPGVYLNPSMVEMCGFGEEIIVGPDAKAVFGGNPAGVLPAGASATPLAGPPIQQPGAAVQPTPGASVQPTPGAAVQPANDFLNPPAGAATGMPPAPAVTVVMYMADNGVAYTAEQLAAAKYSPEQINALPRA